MPRPEDRWGDIVSPLMVSDNYLDWIVCCISDTTTALLRTSGEKKAKAKRAPRKVKRFCHSLGKRRRTLDVSFLHRNFLMTQGLQ